MRRLLPALAFCGLLTAQTPNLFHAADPVYARRLADDGLARFPKDVRIATAAGALDALTILGAKLTRRALLSAGEEWEPGKPQWTGGLRSVYISATLTTEDSGGGRFWRNPRAFRALTRSALICCWSWPRRTSSWAI